MSESSQVKEDEALPLNPPSLISISGPLETESAPPGPIRTDTQRLNGDKPEESVIAEKAAETKKVRKQISHYKDESW